LVQKYELVVKY